MTSLSERISGAISTLTRKRERYARFFNSSRRWSSQLRIGWIVSGRPLIKPSRNSSLLRKKHIWSHCCYAYGNFNFTGPLFQVGIWKFARTWGVVMPVIRLVHRWCRFALWTRSRIVHRSTTITQAGHVQEKDTSETLWNFTCKSWPGWRAFKLTLVKFKLKGGALNLPTMDLTICDMVVSWSFFGSM